MQRVFVSGEVAAAAPVFASQHEVAAETLNPLNARC